MVDSIDLGKLEANIVTDTDLETGDEETTTSTLHSAGLSQNLASSASVKVRDSRREGEKLRVMIGGKVVFPARRKILNNPCIAPFACALLLWGLLDA